MKEEELVDPKTINYPETQREWATYMRLKLAKGQRKLTLIDVARIENARLRRARRDAIRYAR